SRGPARTRLTPARSRCDPNGIRAVGTRRLARRAETYCGFEEPRPNSMKNGVVIIGAGHAGVQAAASLREEGYDGPVTLVGDENELPYHKPPLSKTFIKDPAAKPQMLRAEIFYANNHIDLRLGASVERVDLAGKRLELAGGATLPFD